MIIPFPTDAEPKVAEVGGKGYGLIRLSAAKFAVPPGAVFTTSFFSPWTEALRSSDTWAAFLNASLNDWPRLCGDLQERCLTLSLAEPQLEAIKTVFELHESIHPNSLLAIRSSSPEEDMGAASFAGGYESILGVRGADLGDALKRCFASAFSERIFLYKRQRGFELRLPRFAAVAQLQIDSEVSGVGFSLNPINNDYDEAVIDANWGLGESVVSGQAAPDHFVVDKLTGKPVESRLGSKKKSVWLRGDGGTETREGYRSDEYALDGRRLAELTQALCRIEKLYGCPMDIEWTFAGDALYLLQARPITTYVPLPQEMLTQPGEKRRLYADASLSKGLTTNQPISPLGLSWFADMVYGDFMEKHLGIEDNSPANAIVFTAGGRFYMNLSNLLWLGMKPKKMARSAAATDALLAEIIANIDPKQHRTSEKPPWIRLKLLLLAPKLLWWLRGFFLNVLVAYLAPERARRNYDEKMARYETDFTTGLDFDVPLSTFAQTYTQKLWIGTFEAAMPALLAGVASPDFLVPKGDPEAKSLASKLRQGFDGNVVVEQGMALYRLASQLEKSDFENLEALAKRIETREMPQRFLEGWADFTQRFGFRGPHEMDVASPRYADDPSLALRQMASMAGGEAAINPAFAHQRNKTERENAYQTLMQRFGGLRRLLLKRVYRLIELFGGTRDTPKYYLVMLTHAIRKRALLEGERLVKAGRLDVPEQIFDLTFPDIERASRDPRLDLRALSESRTRFIRKLKDHVRTFPQVIDSRGRIHRPPARDEKPNELKGTPVSAGVATGMVKVLSNPHEKPIEKGDVLVAYTTDPGWTPLFINAAAVVLEIGGTLQHGAVVAREYGKPCVVGIDRVVTRLTDGQSVEVDGASGIVRILDDTPSNG